MSVTQIDKIEKNGNWEGGLDKKIIAYIELFAVRVCHRILFLCRTYLNVNIAQCESSNLSIPYVTSQPIWLLFIETTMSRWLLPKRTPNAIVSRNIVCGYPCVCNFVVESNMAALNFPGAGRTAPNGVVGWIKPSSTHRRNVGPSRGCRCWFHHAICDSNKLCTHYGTLAAICVRCRTRSGLQLSNIWTAHIEIAKIKNADNATADYTLHLAHTIVTSCDARMIYASTLSCGVAHMHRYT